MQQFVIGELEDRQRVAAVRRGLEIVARRAAEGDQPEETGTVHQVHAQLERGASRIAHAPRHGVRQQQSRDVEVGVQPQFVGVQPRGAASGVPVARLPFVGAVELQGEDLAAPEEVVVADLEGDARADEAVRLGGHVGLECRFERVVELRVERDVERVGAPQGVERRDAQVDRAENPQFVEAGLRAALGIDGEELAGFEGERPGEDSGPYLHRTLGDDRGVAQPEGVGRTGADVGQADGDVAHAVGFEGHLGGVRFEVQPHGDPLRRDRRVGEVFQILRTEIVVAPVAQEPRDALPFEREGVEVVLRARAEQRGGVQTVDQGFQPAFDRRVGDLRVAERRRDPERIVHLGLAAVLAVEQGVRGPGAEIAVVFENLLGDPGAQFGLHLGDQHGLFGQPLVEPVFESFFFRRVEIVPRPEADRQRRAQIGAVKRVVRGHGEGLLHGRFGGRGEHDARVGLDADFLHARVQNLARPQTPGGGAGCEQRGGRKQEDAISEALRTHCVVVFRRCASSAGTGRPGAAVSCG